MCEKEHIKSGLFVVVFVFLVAVYGRALLAIAGQMLELHSGLAA